MIEQKENGVILSITAKPGSGKFAVEFKGDKIAVSLESRAQNNRANIELIKEFRRILKKEVSLISGGRSTEKRLLIENAAKEDIERALAALKRD